MGTDTRRLRQAVEADSCIAANRLACYVSALRGYDDAFRLRVILHDFGLVWADADDDEPVKKSLRTIIGAGAPVAVARVEDRDGGGMESTRRT